MPESKESIGRRQAKTTITILNDVGSFLSRRGASLALQDDG